MRWVNGTPHVAIDTYPPLIIPFLNSMDSRNIPFFPYNRFFTSSQKELSDVLQEVLQRGAFILQKECTDLEKNLSEYLNIKHVIGVANATDALILALRAA